MVGMKRSPQGVYTPAMRNPQVPETLEGWFVLHQMFRVRWSSWKALPAEKRQAAASEAATVLGSMEKQADGPSALVALLGHKGDLMLIHFRRDFEGLAAAELRLRQTALFDHLEPTTPHVSMIELGPYHLTGKLHDQIATQKLQP